MVWGPEEVEILETAYAKASWSVLLRVLGSRTRKEIFKKASVLGFKRQVRELGPSARVRFSLRAKTGAIRRGTSKRQLLHFGGLEWLRCRVCKSWLPSKKFTQRLDCAFGRAGSCTTCDGRTAYAVNPESNKRAVRKYQTEHLEKYREIKRAANRRRHGRKMNGPGVSVREVRALLARFENKCAYCGRPSETIDHATPLARGGKHEIENLLPACRECNFEKKTKTREEYEVFRARKGA